MYSANDGVILERHSGETEEARIWDYLEETDHKHTFEGYTCFFLSASLMSWGEHFFFSHILLLVYHLNVRSEILVQVGMDRIFWNHD